MNKIRESIRKKPINFILIAMVLVLYILNNSFLKSVKNSVMHYFFVCYFNDLICPLLLLGYSNILLLTVGHELRKIQHILLFCSATSFVWEFIAPIFKRSSVTDYGDILCYLCGGIIYWWIMRVWSYFEKEEDLYD